VIAQHEHAARARDILSVHGDTQFRSALSALLIADAAPLHRRLGRDPIGSHRLRDGSLAVGIGLTFGHTDARSLDRLADAAATAGATGVRAAPNRTLMVIGLTEPAAIAVADAALSLGFIVDSDDPRRHVIACAGAPICSSAHIAARALAPQVADIGAPYLDGSRRIHVSGCSKGCAHAGSAKLTIVGSPDGCGLIADGSARDTPFALVPTNELPAAIDRFFREQTREDSHV